MRSISLAEGLSVKCKLLFRTLDINSDVCMACGCLCFRLPYGAIKLEDMTKKKPIPILSEFEMGLGQELLSIFHSLKQFLMLPHWIVRNVFILPQANAKSAKNSARPKLLILSRRMKYVELEVGSIILTTGYDLFDARRIPQYGYGRYDNVLTGLEFERMTCAAGPTGGKILLKDGRQPESVAIIHCVGSRDENYHEYCSRVCCMYALKYAHLIKENTQAEVYQMYIDMRCFGEGFEEFYRRVCDEGVNFIRGKVAKVTDVALTEEEQGKLIVIAEDTLLGGIIRVPVDMVILCPALEARFDAEDVAKLFTINRRADGFFMERHVKLDPVATATEGVFIAGCCEGPKDIPDTVAQASAAAAKALSVISRGRVVIEPTTAQVNEVLCQACGRCEEICDFHAPRVISKDGLRVSSVDAALCKGCGACAVVCPTGAMSVRHSTREQINGMVEALLEV